MIDIENTVHGANTLAEPSIADISDIHEAMYLVGSHSGKLMTLLALSTYEQGEYIPKTELRHKLTSFQEEGRGWTPNTQTVNIYCKQSLVPAGLAELGYVNSSLKHRDVEAVRLTGKGRTLGPVVIGALTSLELESISGFTTEAQTPLFLQDALGKTAYKGNYLVGAPMKLAIYDALLKVAPGEGLPEAELQRRLNLKKHVDYRMLRRLCEADILCEDRQEGYLVWSIQKGRREYLQELLHVRQMLAEDSEEAEQFRAAACQQTEALLPGSPSSRRDITSIMAIAQFRSTWAAKAGDDTYCRSKIAAT